MMRALLYELLRVDTQNPPGNERVLAVRIAEYLKGLPCEITVQDVAPGRANVVARLHGREAGHALLLNGHLDTVPNGAHWRTDPQTPVEADGRLYARGASDMKSGLAVLLSAFKAYAASGAQPAHDVVFAGTCDEESLGAGAQALCASGMIDDVDRILIGEPTGSGVGLAAKGCLWLHIYAGGRTSHGAYPDRGVNAIDGLYGFVSQLKGMLSGGSHRLLGSATATLTKIAGGVKANMVPDSAEAVMDIRTLPGADHREIICAIEGAAAAYCDAHPGLTLRCEIENDRMPVETSAEVPFVTRFKAAMRAHDGREPFETRTAFFSDASIFLRSIDAAVIQFGPGESNEAHTPNESVLLSACDAAYDFIAGWLVREASE